jgi:hypothetical protein
LEPENPNVRTDDQQISGQIFLPAQTLELNCKSIAKRLTSVNLRYFTAPEYTMASKSEPRLQPKHLRTAEAALFAAFFERAEGKARRELMRQLHRRA